MSESQVTDSVENVSAHSFDISLERVVRAIADHGMTLFARIDHAANARAVGMAMPPATVLIYGNPKGGTPIMLAAPLVALDLPLRALVRQRADGAVAIAFHPVAAMLGRAGVPGEAAAGLEPAQRMLLAAIAA